MRNRLIKIAVNILMISAIAGATYLAIQNRQDIIDWWELQNYEASSDIAAIADETSMYGRGRDMFYVSKPTVEDASTFNISCSNDSERSIVLGCYTMQRIHLYNVTDERLNGIVEVTAAHEMLHAAYERLDESTKDYLDSLLTEDMVKVQDEHLSDLIKIYNHEEPGELMNEMHSILGTEYSGLSDELEEYYSQYFEDRGVVVALAQQYQSLFTQSQARIQTLEEQMATLKSQIDQNNAQLAKQEVTLGNESAHLSMLRYTDVEAYNSAVSAYNASVNSFNALVYQTQDLVDQHNELVIQYNNEAAAQADLYQSMNSNYQPAG